MLPDEKSGSLCSWDARNSDRERLLALGHTAPTRAFVHSPTMPMLVHSQRMVLTSILFLGLFPPQMTAECVFGSEDVKNGNNEMKEDGGGGLHGKNVF